MEAALSDAERAVLDEWCQRFGIDRDTWHTVAWFARPFEAAAFVRNVESLTAGGVPAERAKVRAALWLGLNEGSQERRMRRS